MRAKLFIRGMKEPIELEKAEAEAAEKLIGDLAKPKETPFSIQGVWSGTKGDMKFVSFPRANEIDVDEFESKIEPMTKAEADVFEKEIAQDREESFRQTGKGYYWRDFYTKRRGGCAIEVYVLKNKNKGISVSVTDPKVYTDVLLEIERYSLYVGKVEFAKKKELEALDNIPRQ